MTDLVVRGLPPKNDTNGPEELGDMGSTSKYVYIGCGTVGAITVVLCFIVLCFYIKKKKEISKRVTVDENPVYGEAYYEGINQIVDQNDYYYTDV